MIRVLTASLLLATGCTFGGDVLSRDGSTDSDRDAGPPERCTPGPTGTADWNIAVVPPEPHVVDGAFSGGEWNEVAPLEGLYTDMYLDVRDGFLYVLNDWRANSTGIQPGCFNEFQLSINEQPIDLRVHENGTVQIIGAPLAGQGAYGFGSSPRHPTAHTIYEFRIAVPDGTVDVCALDPLTRDMCTELVREPMVFTVRSDPGGLVRSRRTQGGTVNRLDVNEPCGRQQGVCADGLTCAVGARSRCQQPGLVDAGPPDTDDGGMSDGGMDAGPDPGDDAGLM